MLFTPLIFQINPSCIFEEFSKMLKFKTAKVFTAKWYVYRDTPKVTLNRLICNYGV